MKSVPVTCQQRAARDGKSWYALVVLSLMLILCGQAAAEEFVSLQSYNYPDHYVRHRNYLGELTPVVSQLDVADSSFRMVQGLAGGNTVSFESRNYPGHYLRHQGFRIKLHRSDGSELFRNDASFRMVQGLADSSRSSFEAVNYPGHFLRHRDFHLYLERGEGDLFRKDCTFSVEKAR
ncbi:MAG: AbfB domain-containing protein [Thermodesulfovibrionales bacterium]